jgi:serine/threonine-protein kinase
VERETQDMSQVESRLSGYDVEEEVGRGDLTVIYRAQGKDDGLPVTVKVVAPEFVSDTYYVRRFLEAGERATRLEHPNIAQVYEAGRREDVVYVIRDWIEDESLAEWLARKGALPASKAVHVVRQLAAALDYAHGQRLMHGDINDRCVFVSGSGHVTLADFGLTQALAGTDSMASVQVTKTSHGVGTPDYLSSERAQGQGPNRAADIYALGVMAYQMLAGEVPFTGEPADVLHAQIYETPAPLHKINPEVPVATSEVVARALAKRPEMRFNTANEFSRALAAAAEGLAPGAAGGRQRLRLWQRPLFWALIIAPVLGLFLAVLIWNLADWGQRQADRLADAFPASTPYTAAASPVLEETALRSTTGAEVTPLQTVPSTPLSNSSLTPISTPGPVTVAEGSPFSNLVLAQDISEDHKPVSPGDDFPVSSRPIYLFFDYRGIKPDTRWGHVWFWGDQQLDRSITTWPEDWGPAGTAWVFYTPEGGYQPGPHEVRLLINDQVVASATFVMR